LTESRNIRTQRGGRKTMGKKEKTFSTKLCLGLPSGKGILRGEGKIGKRRGRRGGGGLGGGLVQNWGVGEINKGKKRSA